MIRTSLTDAFDLGCPILSAGLAFAARPPLAAAVSNAGGMGFLGADLMPAWTVVEMIQATRRLTTRPFGLTFESAFVTDDQIRACVAVRPAVVAFLGPPPAQTWLDELRRRDIDVWLQVRSPAEARHAVRSGATGVIAQGDEIRGHPSSAGLARLLPAVSQAVAPLPVIASGGIADGRRLAAVLMLGADAAWCDSRFLASKEARVCQRRFRPGAGATAMASLCVHRPTRTRSSAPLRGVQGSPSSEADLQNSLLGDRIGLDTCRCDSAIKGLDLAAVLPTPDVVGRTYRDSWLPDPQTAGLWEIKSAAQIVREMSDEAAVVVEAMLSVVTRGGARSSR
jgi:enoyl-[acyl-carrier protein] reductase II